MKSGYTKQMRSLFTIYFLPSTSHSITQKWTNNMALGDYFRILRQRGWIIILLALLTAAA
ncbi:MAG: hypothetical protein GY805_36505, partial [Chloroflexi bacterium]|nr:hypothetical protein [Chloroflexota bacterium]